ncbi:MAG: hypothetical protein M9939_23235 [Mesorhizobium sp.]|nr:hypothetical protein [Mesorhizobium sp.]MCO5164024.1 hypothetical protein [Mesorhizobium sp.]
MEKPERNSHGDRQERRLLLSLSRLVFAVVLVATNPSTAEEVSPAHKITDGRPWKIAMENGRVGTLVLFQNGTGKMTGGPMDLSPKWRPTADGLCLKPGALLPERCVKLVRTGNGYLGINGDKQAFKLER